VELLQRRFGSKENVGREGGERGAGDKKGGWLNRLFVVLRGSRLAVPIKKGKTPPLIRHTNRLMWKGEGTAASLPPPEGGLPDTGESPRGLEKGTQETMVVYPVGERAATVARVRSRQQKATVLTKKSRGTPV